MTIDLRIWESLRAERGQLTGNCSNFLVRLLFSSSFLSSFIRIVVHVFLSPSSFARSNLQDCSERGDVT